MSCNQNNKACGGCPFSKQCAPGELGGSPITTYIGQIIGPFYLPCHAAKNYKGNETKLSPEHAQCAGAAIMRRNIGVAHMMPDPLLKLEEEDPNVFNTIEEFIHHHLPELGTDEIATLVDAAPILMQEQLDIAMGKPGATEKAAVAAKRFNNQ